MVFERSNMIQPYMHYREWFTVILGCRDMVPRSCLTPMMRQAMDSVALSCSLVVSIRITDGLVEKNRDALIASWNTRGRSNRSNATRLRTAPDLSCRYLV
jgi:hypothetical protein